MAVFNDEVKKKRTTEIPIQEIPVGEYDVDHEEEEVRISYEELVALEEMRFDVTWLRVDDMKISIQMANAIATAIKFVPNVSDVYFQNNQMGDEAAIIIASEFHSLPKLRSVDFVKNEIGDRAAIFIADALRDFEQMCSIGMYENNITNAGAFAIARVLPNFKKLWAAHFSHNNIGQKGVHALMKSIQGLTEVEEWNFDNQELSIDQVELAMKAVPALFACAGDKLRFKSGDDSEFEFLCRTPDPRYCASLLPNQLIFKVLKHPREWMLEKHFGGEMFPFVKLADGSLSTDTIYMNFSQAAYLHYGFGETTPEFPRDKTEKTRLFTQLYEDVEAACPFILAEPGDGFSTVSGDKYKVFKYCGPTPCAEYLNGEAPKRFLFKFVLATTDDTWYPNFDQMEFIREIDGYPVYPGDPHGCDDPTNEHIIVKPESVHFFKELPWNLTADEMHEMMKKDLGTEYEYMKLGRKRKRDAEDEEKEAKRQKEN